MTRLWVGLGALAGLLAVAIAAAAVHVLPGRVGPGGQALVQSALRIQGWHALALLFCGLWAPRDGTARDRPSERIASAFARGRNAGRGSPSGRTA